MAYQAEDMKEEQVVEAVEKVIEVVVEMKEVEKMVVAGSQVVVEMVVE